MATLCHVCVLLTALACLWVQIVLSAPSTKPEISDTDSSKTATSPKDTPTSSAQSKAQEQVVATAFQVPTPLKDGVMFVAALEGLDGVKMPPQVHEYIVDFFNHESHEMEMMAPRGRVKRSYDRDLVGQLAKSIGQQQGYGHGNGYNSNNGNSYGGYGYSNGGNRAGYGGQGQSYGGSSHDGGYGDSGLYSGHSGNDYGKGLHVPNEVNYGHSYTKSPMISFVKGFKPGKTYVDKGYVIRNYFRHGTYDVALQHYKLIPTVKVVPYTTYKKIGVGKKVETKHRYKAYICKYCYHGYPKIDVYEMKKPYSHTVRRFIYLPMDYKLDGHGYQNEYGHGNGYQNGNDDGHGDEYGHDSYGSNKYGYGGNDYGYSKNDYGYGHNDYGYGETDYGKNDYGYGKNDYGYSQSEHGYGKEDYGYGKHEYGYGKTDYGKNDYGYGKNDYGYSQKEYGKNDYGYGKHEYGYEKTDYGKNNYGYGKNDYGYGKNDYGYGKNDYGYGKNDYGYGDKTEYGYGSSHGNGYGDEYGKAKVTYHNYDEQEHGGYGNTGYGNNGYSSGGHSSGYGYERK